MRPLNTSGYRRKTESAMPQPIDPRHRASRDILRVIGPAVAALGLILVVIGTASFFMSFGEFEPPKYFWCAFVGLPLFALGMVLSKFGFAGAVTRYLAEEVAPVGKDVVNYMADGTKGAVRDVAAAIADGLRAGGEGEQVRMLRCYKCNTDNEMPANFCKQCGAPFTKTKSCPQCGELNDPDARFCDRCGTAVP